MTSELESQKGPCSYMVDTWASKEFLYLYFGVHYGTIAVLGPFGVLIACKKPTGIST